MAESSHVLHEIHPVFNTDSRILILGSFPSVKSRESQFFYGHPRNRFWNLIATLTDEPLPVGIEEKKSLLLAHHIVSAMSFPMTLQRFFRRHPSGRFSPTEALPTAYIKNTVFHKLSKKQSVCRPQVRQMQPGQRNACSPNGIRSVLILNKSQQTCLNRLVQK